jgi:hypothetical protein
MFLYHQTTHHNGHTQVRQTDTTNMKKSLYTGMEFTHSTCFLTTNRNLGRSPQPIAYLLHIHTSTYLEEHVTQGPEVRTGSRKSCRKIKEGKWKEEPLRTTVGSQIVTKPGTCLRIYWESSMWIFTLLINYWVDILNFSVDTLNLSDREKLGRKAVVWSTIYVVLLGGSFIEYKNWG